MARIVQRAEIRDIAAEDDIGQKIAVQHVARKVVVESAVEQRMAIDHDGFEVKRIGHRRPHRLCHISPGEDRIPLFHHIRRHTAEGNEQPIELTGSLRRGGTQLAHKSPIRRKTLNEPCLRTTRLGEPDGSDGRILRRSKKGRNRAEVPG